MSDHTPMEPFEPRLTRPPPCPHGTGGPSGRSAGGRKSGDDNPGARGVLGRPVADDRRSTAGSAAGRGGGRDRPRGGRRGRRHPADAAHRSGRFRLSSALETSMLPTEMAAARPRSQTAAPTRSSSATSAQAGRPTVATSPRSRRGRRFLTPAVDLMTAGGAVVRTIALDPGCCPRCRGRRTAPRSRSDVPSRRTKRRHRRGRRRLRDRASRRRAGCHR